MPGRHPKLFTTAVAERPARELVAKDVRGLFAQPAPVVDFAVALERLRPG
jgi:hypothetical protein